MIGKKIAIRGTLSGDEDLTVEGRIEGTVRLTRDLTVAESATLIAEIEAQSVAISGRVEGDVTAPDGVHLDANAVVIGALKTEHLVIEDGARFKGQVEMDFEIPGLEPDEEAPIAPERAARRRP